MDMTQLFPFINRAAILIYIKNKVSATTKDSTMLELKGKYCKDCKIFTDNIDQEALSMVYHFLDNPMFEGSKIRIMPDVHAGKDIVVGFTVPFTDHVNPDHVGGDIGCSVSTAITDMPINPEDYPMIEKSIREGVKFGMKATNSYDSSVEIDMNEEAD